MIRVITDQNDTERLKQINEQLAKEYAKFKIFALDPVGMLAQANATTKLIQQLQNEQLEISGKYPIR